MRAQDVCTRGKSWRALRFCAADVDVVVCAALRCSALRAREKQHEVLYVGEEREAKNECAKRNRFLRQNHCPCICKSVWARVHVRAGLVCRQQTHTHWHINLYVCVHVCIVGEPVYLPPRRRLRRRSLCRAASPCSLLLFLLLAPLRDALCFCCCCTFVFLPSLWPPPVYVVVIAILFPSRSLSQCLCFPFSPCLALTTDCEKYFWLRCACPTYQRRTVDCPFNGQRSQHSAPLSLPQHTVPPLLTHWWLCSSFTNWFSA